ncbi:hypothetical protein N9O57_01160 [bacterium]|nr:hypothetical protein [bacterium]
MKALILLTLIFSSKSWALDCSPIEYTAIQNSIFTKAELECLIQDYRRYTAKLEDPSIDNLIHYLPSHFKRNFALKHGKKSLGANGHYAGKADSQSARKTHPRAILWDEKTGLTLTYNAHPEDRFNHRLDIYYFDFKTKAHHLTAWYQDQGETFRVEEGESCMGCHGPSGRPIWPMYPDWPQFYGSFNDELAAYPKSENDPIFMKGSEIQKTESSWYKVFLEDQGSTHPRYSPLYQKKGHLDNWISKWSETDHFLFPYRPNNAKTGLRTVSRAFHHRPNLRLGVLYNRLVTLGVVAKIEESPVFQEFKEVFLYSLMDCNWQNYKTARSKVFPAFIAKIKETYGHTLNLSGYDGSFGSSYAKSSTYRQIPYDQLLKAVGIKVQDVDFRFQYNSRMYQTSMLYNTSNIMDIGYMVERSNQTVHSGKRFRYISPGTKYFSPSMKYFNSYFDGSATSNELMAAQILKILAAEKPQNFARFNNKNYLRTLTQKYTPSNGKSNRLERDREFFNRVDQMSPWIPMPYPSETTKFHHRESFFGNFGRVKRHRDICNALGDEVEASL